MSTPAGWYPQPDGQQRYWDGQQWTENFAPGVSPGTPEGISSETAPGAARKNWFLRHKVLTAIGAVLLLGIFSSLGNLGTKSEPVADVATKTVATSQAPNQSAEDLAAAQAADKVAADKAAADKVAADKAAADKAAADKASAAAAAKKAAADKAAADKAAVLSFSGKGSDVVKFKKPISDTMLVTTTWTGGDSNNTIYSLDGSGKETDLLVNTIGSYHGSSIINKSEGETTAAFKVEGNGSWKVTVKPIAQANRWDGTKPLSGAGDGVIIVKDVFTGLDSLKFTSTHAEGNITVYGLGNSEDLIVNDIANFSGKYLVPEGVVLLQISSDGRWNLSKV